VNSEILGTLLCWLIGVAALAGVTAMVARSGVDRQERVGIVVTGIVFLGTGALIVSRYFQGDPMFAVLGGGFYLAASAFMAWLCLRRDPRSQMPRDHQPIER
jgi:CHASE2 domain-containing sensor protein